MDSQEYAKCNICERESNVSRKYYYYDIRCNCCNTKNNPHFEIVMYCKDCKPTPPKTIKVMLEPFDDKL